jgi:hypothetical protein
MGINFPSSPTAGQVFSVPAQFAKSPYGNGPSYRFSSGAWRKAAGTALRANKFVNPAMQISQERGDTPLVCLPGYVFYPADQWRADFSMAAGTQITCHRLAGVTPRGSKYRLYMSVTAAQASIGATEYVIIRQYLEGNRIADLNWGTTAALWAVLRFGFRGPAGTYTAALRNAASPNRGLIFPFTVSAADANWDQEYSFVVPPETSGAWSQDNTTGGELLVAIAAGSNYYAPGTYSWQASNLWTDSSITNNINTVGKQFMLFDVGLHADPNMTGVAPEFQAPGFHTDLQDCLRYWYPGYRFNGVVNAATNGYGWHSHYVPMRISPAFSIVGTLRGYEATVAPNITALGAYNTNSESGSELFTAGTTMAVGRPFMTLVDGQLANYIAVSARF